MRAAFRQWVVILHWNLILSLIDRSPGKNIAIGNRMTTRQELETYLTTEEDASEL